MSYIALARRWRPRTFSQLMGQEHITKTLINSLNQKKIHHAYLFTGTRGVGKTSVARILAKALNCEQGISSEPCLQCPTCIAIEQGRYIDLIEIDGASKTRVEDTRELLENVQYAATSGRYKIYLIDEVHMLSKHSFNALLKTLEEPPEHVKFILATTDPQELPVTVLSRCLQFGLRHLEPGVISMHLQEVLNQELVNFEPAAVVLLAQAAQGSMRDALSLLDQALAGTNDVLLARDVKILLGSTQLDYALEILSALAEQNPSLLLEISHKIAQEGSYFNYVLNQLLQYFHQLSVYQCLGENNPLINPIEDIKALSSLFSAEDIQLFYQICLKGNEEIHYAPTAEISFNMTLLRMLMFRPAPDPMGSKLNFQHKPLMNQKKSLRKQDHEQQIKIDDEISSTITTANTKQLFTPDTISNDNHSIVKSTNWAEIIPQLNLTGFALNALEHSEFIAKEGKEVQLKIAKGHQSLFTPTTLTRIETALTDFYHNPVKVKLVYEDKTQASPAQEKQKLTAQKQLQAESALHVDPLFRQLQQDFSAELVKNSIVPRQDDL